MNLAVCQKCQYRQRPCAGRCVCLEGGLDITEHAATGKCPKDFFRTAAIEAELVRQGYEPETSADSPLVVSCCSPPKP